MPRHKKGEHYDAHIMISIEADEDYSSAVGVIAGQLRMTKGRLVRRAIDAMLGDELQATLASFARSDARKEQLFHEGNRS